MTTQTETEFKTCKVTLVNPGSSDSVIKIYPAEHEEEKIWLDKRPGIERWEAVKRFMYSHAPRGAFVPSPVKYHQDRTQLHVRSITDNDIPLVRLEGVVFTPPPPEEKFVEKPKEDPQADLKARVALLEAALMAKIKEEVRAEARPPALSPVAEVPVAAELHCPECEGKEFKSSHALAIHQGRFHKK